MTVCKVLGVELYWRRATLSLELAPPNAEWPEGGDTELLALRWEGPQDGYGEVTILASALRRAKENRVRVVVALPALQGPLRSLEVRPLAAISVLKFRDKMDERLKCIFPATDDEYIAFMQSHHVRWGNKKTRYFLAAQVARFFGASPEHKLGATLIMAYKAVELMERPFLEASLPVIEEGILLARGLPVDWHPRRNGEHLEISLLTALWHVRIALGEVDAALDVLRRLREAAGRLTNYATASLSATKGLLLLGWLEWRMGHQNVARACWEETVQVFKRAVQDSDPLRAVLFRELSHSLESATQASLCLRALGARLVHEMPSLADVLLNAARVSVQIQERMQQMIEAHFAQAADRDAARSGQLTLVP